MQGIDQFDISQIQPGGRGFSGAVFDGRYVYYVPLNNGQFHGQVSRHDTQMSFTDPASWQAFDSTQVHANSRGFVDGVFDGRYVYFIPFCHDEHHGQVTRYDTQRKFDDAASWEVFDSTQVHPHSKGFVSGCFDGRYVVFAPYQLDHSTQHGQVTRYDTQSVFTDPMAWEVFDTASMNSHSRGFHSAVASDAHVYMIPYFKGEGEYSGLLFRHAREKSFTDPAAWEVFDLTILDSRYRGFVGGLCHQGFLYLAPYFDGEDRHGRVLRFDMSKPLADATAWTSFDTASADAGSRGFFGAVCDGKNLILVPHCRGVGNYHGQVTRYDLEREFTDRDSWSICQLEHVDEFCKGFIGGVIHQDALYLAPFETDAGAHSGLAVRMPLNDETLWSRT